MKGWKDNKAVWFEFEFTSYAPYKCHGDAYVAIKKVP